MIKINGKNIKELKINSKIIAEAKINNKIIYKKAEDKIYIARNGVIDTNNFNAYLNVSQIQGSYSLSASGVRVSGNGGNYNNSIQITLKDTSKRLVIDSGSVNFVSSAQPPRKSSNLVRLNGTQVYYLTSKTPFNTSHNLSASTINNLYIEMYGNDDIMSGYCYCNISFNNAWIE